LTTAFMRFAPFHWGGRSWNGDRVPSLCLVPLRN